jgi:N-acetylmuramoyl-L-alanine amidase
MKTVCLSAGHAPGLDPGAVFEGLVEADLNIKIVRKAADFVRKHSVGVLEVPDNLNLVETIKWVNERDYQIDVAVEVHVNAGRGTGVETWYYQDSQKSQKLAQFLVDGLAVETGLPNRGTRDETTSRWGQLGFIHESKPLAALVECGFIDHHIDRNLLVSDSGLEKFSKGLARGLVEFLKVGWQPALLYPPEAEVVAKPVVDEVLSKRVEKMEDSVIRLEDSQNRLNEKQSIYESKFFDLVKKLEETVKKLADIKNIL